MVDSAQDKRHAEWGFVTGGSRSFGFGAFELDVHSGELRKHGLKVRLPNQSFHILLLLLEHPGEVVTREQLRQKLWPADTFVDFDAGLGSAVKKLREALGDAAEKPRFVETLPRRGYRFIASVNGGGEAAVATASPRISQVRPRRLKITAVATAAVLVAGALVGLNVGHSRDRLLNWVDPPQVRSVAVLPLENLTGDPVQDSLVNAMTDSLTTELARAGLVDVASRTSAMQFKESRLPLPAISRQLNVDAVVEGTVSRAGEGWLLNVQLIHGSTDRHLWAQSYKGEMRDIAPLSSEIAWEILRAIPPRLQPESQRGLAHRRPQNQEAYEAYVLGRHFLSRGRQENNVKAATYFQQAIERDPGYAPAYSGLSDAYRKVGSLDIRQQHLLEAEAAARKALELDANLAEAHTSLGGVLWRHWKWDEAEKELRRALELDSTYAEGYRVYGMFLVMLRRFDEALAALRRAHELDRLSLVINVEYATALTRVGLYDEALQQLERTRELDPNFSRVFTGMAFVYVGKGDLARAVAILEEARTRQAGSRPWLGYVYGVSGRTSEALEILNKLETAEREQTARSIELAVVHLGLGNKERALDFLEKAYNEEPANVVLTGGLPGMFYELLRDEPRYQTMLKNMGLQRLIPPKKQAAAPGNKEGRQRSQP